MRQQTLLHNHAGPTTRHTLCHMEGPRSQTFHHRVAQSGRKVTRMRHTRLCQRPVECLLDKVLCSTHLRLQLLIRKVKRVLVPPTRLARRRQGGRGRLGRGDSRRRRDDHTARGRPRGFSWRRCVHAHTGKEGESGRRCRGRRGGGQPVGRSGIKQVMHQPDPARAGAGVTPRAHAAQLYLRQSNSAALQARGMRHRCGLDHNRAARTRGQCGHVTVPPRAASWQWNVVIPVTTQALTSSGATRARKEGECAHPSSRQLTKRRSSTMNRLPLPGRTGGPTGPTAS